MAGRYPLDEKGATQIGRAVGRHFAEPGQKVIIGCDTRQSSERLVAALAAGLNDVGVNVTAAGVITTPGLAYLTREIDDFVAGVMVTASHNPYQYNGVKVFDRRGDKLPDATEARLNALIESGVEADRSRGSLRQDDGLVGRYEDFLVESAGGLELRGMRLAVDSANGSASGIAERIFGRLGANVTPLFDAPDGKNINDGCGATATGALSQAVIKGKLDLGIALDGDADRLAMIDERGREVNGDHLMYLLAVSGKFDGVVATVMSNLGFEKALEAQGIKLERVAVGDRYVLEGLKATGFQLGGEQSGHIIFPRLLATGDGLLAAVQSVKALSLSGQTLAQWRDRVKILPQALVNIPLHDRRRLDDPDVKAFVAAETGKLEGKGRLLIRPSGTEPLARVMVEAPDAQGLAGQIAAGLQNLTSTNARSEK